MSPTGRRSEPRRLDRTATRRLLATVLTLLLVSTGTGLATASPRNGALPGDELRRVGGVLLAPEAAGALQALLDAAEVNDVPIVITDGYRSYEAQIELKLRKPRLAAVPGTSMHGWGRAIDVDTSRTDMSWLHRHGPSHGWELPAWARPDGSKPEPWHWEYVGRDALPASGTTVAAERVLEPGDVIGELQLRRASWPAGPSVTVLEGLDELDGVVGHYPGTSVPGSVGNAALAGYRTSNGAPLRGLTSLGPGDSIVIRDLDGAPHTYSFVARAVLNADDTWAIGPDPLGLGLERMLTVTTGTTAEQLAGQLSVTWFTPDPVARCPATRRVPVPCPPSRAAAGLLAR